MKGNVKQTRGWDSVLSLENIWERREIPKHHLKQAGREGCTDRHWLHPCFESLLCVAATHKEAFLSKDNVTAWNKLLASFPGLAEVAQHRVSCGKQD